MKLRVIHILLVVGFLPFSAYSQLLNGGLYSGFGVDADTRANWMKYGLVTGNVTSDDWFAPSGSGYNVIDTTNWASYLAQLQAGNNIAFSQRMSRLLYSKVGGKLWLDAVYGRDYSSASSLKDSTMFTVGSKNGDNPNTWNGGISSTPNKNDLIDVYAHMRRDGLTPYDSLWFFTGIAAFGNAANSYYDVELYKNNLAYNFPTKTFTSAGTSGGHTEWLFDATGRVTQTGDMIVAVSFMPGSPPTIDVRLWVSQVTFTAWSGAQQPVYFNFNGTYSSTMGTWGYASIVSKAGTTAFGAGISNYSGLGAQDSTYSTPWGTSNSTAGWASQYVGSQFIEVGLNLTRIGVDPALYSTLNPCQSMFSNIFFASRSSSSFTADLKDFVGPLTFLRQPLMNFGVQGDTLRCNRPVGTITASDNTTAGYYTWKTLNGGAITGANADSSQLTISKTGSYVVSASPAQGCPATQVDTIVVPIDTFPPVASASVGLSGNKLHLYGGNVAASNYPTPFGGSQGLNWNWTGPSSFTSTIQNPITDTVWGTYNLTVTERRNGCTANASVNVQSSMFTILLSNAIQLEGKPGIQQVELTWHDLDQSLDLSFVVERSDGVNDFQSIGTVADPYTGGPSGPGSFAFVDAHPLNGSALYRIKALTANGSVYYSPTITVGIAGSVLANAWLASNDAASPTLFVRSTVPSTGVLVEYTITGQVLQKTQVSLSPGINTIPISGGARMTAKAIALYVDGRIAWCQKMVF